MEEDVHKIHEKSTEYFASKEFRTFRDELAFRGIPSNPSPFVGLSFKCCGYGYFPQYKERMRNNFLRYLEDALNCSPKVKTLNIIYNGFELNGECLKRILMAVGRLIETQ